MTVYKLANKSTSIFSNARIWNEYKKGYNNSKHKYTIQLKENKLFFEKSYNASFQTPAAKTKRVGKISKGSYKVNITKHTYTAAGLGLKGTGKIKQYEGFAMTLIEAKELTKIYQQGVQPIYGMHPVSFQIDRGTMNLIKGRSGSGKTTLLNMLAGLDEPTKGQVLFQNSNFYGLSEQKQTRIRAADFGFIFQSFHLLPELKVEDNICLPLLIANHQVDQSYFRELIEVLDITDLIKKYPFQISGGQQQRVAIARALIHRPLVIFADEPTGNLDKKNSERVMKILTNLCEKQHTTIVLVTHDEGMVKHPDQILEVEEGRVSIYKGVHENATI